MSSRLGEVNYNNFGSKMEIINCRRSDDIDIYFEEYNWIAKNREYKEFVKKAVVCPYEKRTYGVGYLGEGKYKARKDKKIYEVWVKILQRCYDKKYQKKYPTYIDCVVCEEWYNFQNFAKWYEENYYEVNNEVMHLDKDILFKGNKIYSPQTCMFVPQRINTLFVKSDKNRGKFLIGCDNHKEKIRVRCLTTEGSKHLGYFSLNEPFKAFTCYKNFKENYIKQVADEYKDLIPIELYEAMYKYKIEITD